MTLMNEGSVENEGLINPELHKNQENGVTEKR